MGRSATHSTLGLSSHPVLTPPHLLPEIQIHPRGQLHLLSLKLRSTWSASLFLQPHCDRPASHFLPLGERTPLYSQSEAWEGDGQGGPWAEHPLLRGRHLACSKSSPTCKLRRECTAFLRGFLRIKYCLRNSSQMLLYNIHVPWANPGRGIMNCDNHGGWDRVELSMDFSNLINTLNKILHIFRYDILN